MVREAVAYVRVSTKEQEDSGFSIPAQKELLASYAAESGFTVVRTFEESETARTSGKRPAFAQMIALLCERPETVLLVEKTDRLVRNLRDFLTLEELGTEIHFVKEGCVISSTAHSSKRFLQGIKVLLAKNYSENLSEEIRKGMTKKASQGSFPSAAPLGYCNAKDAPGIVPDPVSGPLVRLLFERAETGFYSGAELTRLARSLGLRSKKGAVLNKNTVCTNVLRNPAYYGTFRWGGSLYEGKYEPLVAKERFDAVQSVLDGRRNGTSARHVFTFSGLVRCATCGGLMSGTVKKGRYIYYACQGRRSCRRYFPEGFLDEETLKLLDGIRLDPPVIEWLMSELEKTTRANPVDEARLAHARKRLSELKTLRDRGMEKMLLGKISDEDWSEQQARWRQEGDELTAIVKPTDEPFPRERFLAAARRPMELLKVARNQFVTRQPVERRRLLQTLVWNFTVGDAGVAAAMRSPFDLLAKGAETKEWWS